MLLMPQQSLALTDDESTGEEKLEEVIFVGVFTRQVMLSSY